jgi:hypothetical protein
MEILTDIIRTANIAALPVVIVTALGILTLVVQSTGRVRAEKELHVGSMWGDALDLVETVLRMATDLLVQFSGQSVSKLVLHSFSDATDTEATVTGILISITLLYALTRASSRPPIGVVAS